MDLDLSSAGFNFHPFTIFNAELIRICGANFEPLVAIEFFETGRVELYDLTEDIGERHDLSAEQPEVTQRLLDELEIWRNGLDAPMPTRLPAPSP